jgi:RimJ/RimL family protein N-acetyltransferase
MKSLKTERLVFRPYIKCEADRTAIVELLTDDEVMMYVGDGVVTKEKAEEQFNRIFANVYELSAFDVWGVFSRADSSYVGHAEIKPRKGTNDWEIIYILKREYWRRGYATEIAEALVKYGFQDRKLTRVIATVDAENKDSIRVLERAGMKLDGKETDEQGEFLVYAIKRNE